MFFPSRHSSWKQTTGKIHRHSFQNKSIAIWISMPSGWATPSPSLPRGRPSQPRGSGWHSPVPLSFLSSDSRCSILLPLRLLILPPLCPRFLIQVSSPPGVLSPHSCSTSSSRRRHGYVAASFFGNHLAIGLLLGFFSCGGVSVSYILQILAMEMEIVDGGSEKEGFAGIFLGSGGR